MKRTFLVLATLVTIILMSCGYLENSISSAEDMNKPKALKLASQDDIAMEEALSSSSSAITVLSSSSISCFFNQTSMGFFTTIKGATVNSNVMVCSIPSLLPASAVITKVQVKFGTLTYNGAVTTNSLTIKKDSISVTINGGIAGGGTVTTYALNGLPVVGTYYVSFEGTCVGFGIGAGSSFCSKSYNNVSLIIHYEY